MLVKRKTMFDLVKEDTSLLDNIEESIDYQDLIDITNIWENTMEDIPLSEAFVDNFKSERLTRFKEKLASTKDLKNQWKKLTKTMVTHKWVERYITPAQEQMVKKYFDICNKSDVSWHDYRLGFVQLCKFFGLPNKGVILEWIEFQDKGNEGRVVACRYSKGICKVNIPQNIKLTHFSPMNGLIELNPSFKSKTSGKFFYDSPRVYFTIKEKLNPFKFGIDAKVTRVCYQTVDYIPFAYIDPTYILFKDRCCYVETTKPIKVQRVGETSGKNIISGIRYDKVKESVDLCLEDSNWRTQEDSNKRKVFKSTNVLEADYQRLVELNNTMRSCNGYAEYKRAFDEFCNYCHINPNGTILTNIVIKSGKTEDTNQIYVEYSYNTRKVTLPEGSRLYHMSTVEGLTVLKPFFRGKAAKGFLYDKPRIYLTIKSKMPKFAADYKHNEKVHLYEVIGSIPSDVYVDPLLPNKLASAVYVETTKPLKCREVNEANFKGAED